MLVPIYMEYLDKTINIINIGPKFSNIKKNQPSPPPVLGEYSEVVLNNL